MSTLQLKHIYKVYPNGNKAVNDFNLDIKDNEFIVFVGPSGCGKSTTLRMIAGLEEISNGELYIDNVMVNYVEPKNRDIAMVFQNYALYPHLSVYENIAFGLKLRHMKKEEIDKRVQSAAEMLGLKDYLKSKPGAMSGGQRQRVALGRALVREPKVFLLDEPLSNLDAKLRANMREEISKLHEKLKTNFIYVTHDQVEAMTMGDRIVVMKLGYVQQIDTPKNLYRYPANKFVASFIGTPQMNFTNATLNKEDDKVRMTFVGTETSFLLPLDYFIKVNPKYFDGKTEVSFALRSEYISNNPKAHPFKCKVKISSVEELGTECQVYANFNIEEDIATFSQEAGNSKSNIAFKTSADFEGKSDDVIEVSLDLEKMHLFDNQTELVINPLVPTFSYVTGQVKKGKLMVMGGTYPLPPAIKLEDGEYYLNIPLDAVSEEKGLFNDEVKQVDKIGNNYLTSFVYKQNVLFLFNDKKHKVGENVTLKIDIKRCDFYKNNELIHEHLRETNEFKGMVYYHKEKDSEGKRVKILDYLIDDLEIPCFNPVAIRSFITNRDRTVYDLDLGFRVKNNQIHVDNEKGYFTMKPLEILDFGDTKYLKCKYKEDDFYILLENTDIDMNSDVKVRVDFDEAKVFDINKDIRLV